MSTTPKIKSRATTPLVPGRTTPRNFKVPPKFILLPINKLNFSNEKILTLKRSNFLMNITRKTINAKSNSPKPRFLDTVNTGHMKSQPLKRTIKKEIYIPWVRKLKDSFESESNFQNQTIESQISHTIFPHNLQSQMSPTISFRTQ
jgi:hypothetical protein